MSQRCINLSRGPPKLADDFIREYATPLLRVNPVATAVHLKILLTKITKSLSISCGKFHKGSCLKLRIMRWRTERLEMVIAEPRCGLAGHPGIQPGLVTCFWPAGPLKWAVGSAHEKRSQSDVAGQLRTRKKWYNIGFFLQNQSNHPFTRSFVQG